jgi:hypothetical protein
MISPILPAVTTCSIRPVFFSSSKPWIREGSIQGITLALWPTASAKAEIKKLVEVIK